MENFISVSIPDRKAKKSVLEKMLRSANLQENNNKKINYGIFEGDDKNIILKLELPSQLSEKDSDSVAHNLSEDLFNLGYNDFDIEISTDEINDSHTLENTNWHTINERPFQVLGLEDGNNSFVQPNTSLPYVQVEMQGRELRIHADTALLNKFLSLQANNPKFKKLSNITASSGVTPQAKPEKVNKAKPWVNPDGPDNKKAAAAPTSNVEPGSKEALDAIIAKYAKSGMTLASVVAMEREAIASETPSGSDDSNVFNKAWQGFKRFARSKSWRVKYVLAHAAEKMSLPGLIGSNGKFYYMEAGDEHGGPEDNQDTGPSVAGSATLTDLLTLAKLGLVPPTKIEKIQKSWAYAMDPKVPGKYRPKIDKKVKAIVAAQASATKSPTPSNADEFVGTEPADVDPTGDGRTDAEKASGAGKAADIDPTGAPTDAEKASDAEKTQTTEPVNPYTNLTPDEAKKKAFELFKRLDSILRANPRLGSVVTEERKKILTKKLHNNYIFEDASVDQEVYNIVRDLKWLSPKLSDANQRILQDLTSKAAPFVARHKKAAAYSSDHAGGSPDELDSVKPGTGKDGPPGANDTRPVEPGTGKLGPANRYDPNNKADVQNAKKPEKASLTDGVAPPEEQTLKAAIKFNWKNKSYYVSVTKIEITEDNKIAWVFYKDEKLEKGQKVRHLGKYWIAQLEKELERRGELESLNIIDPVTSGKATSDETSKLSALAAFAKSNKGGLKNDTDEKEAIRELQKFLGITVDGVYGPQTVSAVKKYQEKNELKVDGDAGPNTIEHMLASIKTSSGTASQSGVSQDAKYPTLTTGGSTSNEDIVKDIYKAVNGTGTKEKELFAALAAIKDKKHYDEIQALFAKNYPTKLKKHPTMGLWMRDDLDGWFDRLGNDDLKKFDDEMKRLGVDVEAVYKAADTEKKDGVPPNYDSGSENDNVPPVLTQKDAADVTGILKFNSYRRFQEQKARYQEQGKLKPGDQVLIMIGGQMVGKYVKHIVTGKGDDMMPHLPNDKNMDGVDDKTGKKINPDGSEKQGDSATDDETDRDDTTALDTAKEKALATLKDEKTKLGGKAGKETPADREKMKMITRAMRAVRKASTEKEVNEILKVYQNRYKGDDSTTATTTTDKKSTDTTTTDKTATDTATVPTGQEDGEDSDTDQNIQQGDGEGEKDDGEGEEEREPQSTDENIANVANALWEAVDGWGTEEKDIRTALQGLKNRAEYEACDTAFEQLSRSEGEDENLTIMARMQDEMNTRDLEVYYYSELRRLKVPHSINRADWNRLPGFFGRKYFNDNIAKNYSAKTGKYLRAN